MSADDCGYDRGIGNPKTLHSTHTKVVVHHSQRIGAHFAGAHGVIQRLDFRA